MRPRSREKEVCWLWAKPPPEVYRRKVGGLSMVPAHLSAGPGGHLRRLAKWQLLLLDGILPCSQKRFFGFVLYTVLVKFNGKPDNSLLIEKIVDLTIHLESFQIEVEELGERGPTGR